MKLACVCEVTSGREMAGRHLRNRSITFEEDSKVDILNNVRREVSRHFRNKKKV